MKAKMAAIIRESSDSSLTHSELRRKYQEPQDGPPSPRLKATSTAYSRTIQMNLIASTRCWACSTALHDPGATFFACGACGAFNGEEPKLPHAPFDTTPFSIVCRVAAQRGRLAAVLSAITLKASAMVLVLVLLPRLVDPSSAWALTSVGHSVLVVYLAFGVAFNYFATVASGPGYVTDELNPLGTGGGRESLSGVDTEVGASRGLELSRLREVTDDDMPLRGWRKCSETGLSAPPRAHYCRHSRKLVLRMDHHCALLNTCIGHANHVYYMRLLAFTSAMGLYMVVGAGYALRAAAAASASAVAVTGLRLNATLAAEEAAAAAAGTSRALVLTASLGVVLVVAALPLFAWQLRNLLKGLTHIESLKTPPPLDFDLGWRENVRTALAARGGGAELGWRLALQALPLPCAPAGDGVRWQCRPPPRRV